MSAKFNCDVKTIRLGFAEFSASAMLLCLGCLGCIGSDNFPNSSMQMGLNFGLVVMTCIQCFYCISGAHINPCVSIAAMIIGELHWSLGLMYILCQFLGAFFGFGIALLISPDKDFFPSKYFCVTVPNMFVSYGAAIAFEYVLTATWIFAMCAVWHRRNVYLMDSVSVRIGLIVSCLTMTGAYFTGASMNPARSLAPAIFTKYFKKLEIYFLGPLLAAVTIPLAWKFLYVETDLKASRSRKSIN